MTSPATLESSSPLDFDQHELHIEESLLKRKAAILEEFLRNDGQETIAIEDRCRILRRKIDLLEDEIAVAGRTISASYYLQNTPKSHFVAITREKFSEWLNQASLPEVIGPARLAQEASCALPVVISPRRHSEVVRSDEIIAISPFKRARTDANEKPPCLRCKILKKRCDSFEFCAHCPIQSYESTGDYWKVLGCFRGRLRDMSAVFCPEYSRSTQRSIKYLRGGSDILNFVLTKSRVSEQKKRRILYLVQSNDAFSELSPSSWANVEDRYAIGRRAISLDLFHGDAELLENAKLENYEAAWSILQVVSMDPAYVKSTTYNLFTLLALGNSFSKEHPAPWEIYSKAKSLLRQSVELYLLERLCGQIASGEMETPPFDTLRETPNTLVLVDLKGDFEAILVSFEKLCVGRTKLTGHAQLACFYALLVLSITKSLLIDAYSLRAEYETAASWKHAESVKISSAFKALTGVYCWSSKWDVVLQDDPGADAQWSKALRDTRSLVQNDLWGERGLKSSKEFLLSLGSCWYPDGSYNGFLVQRFGLDVLPTFSNKSAEIGRPQSGHSHSKSPSLEHASMNSSVSHARHTVSDALETLTWVSQTQFTTSSTETEFSRSSGQVASLQFVCSENNDDPSGLSKSRRKGALSPNSLLHARSIRKIGACWNCWAMKVPCSEGEVCHRCQAKRGSRAYKRCNRGSLDRLYSLIFFPDFLVTQYRAEAINDYIIAQKLEVVSEDMNIDVLWNGDKPRKICVRIYFPSSEIEEHAGYHARDGHKLGVESLPIGLSLHSGFTEKDFLDELELDIETQERIDCVSSRHGSTLMTICLDTIFRFHKSGAIKHPSIYKGLLLCSAIHAVNYPLVISDSSTALILKDLNRIKEDEKLYSSHILNRQMKAIMFNTCRQLIAQFLSEIERSLKKRQRSLWPVCFAAVILLCVVIEMLQTLLYAHVHVEKSLEPDESGLGREPRESCEKLDHIVYGQLSHIFHTIYRTAKGDRDGLNPFGADFDDEDDIGFDGNDFLMIHTLREKVMNKDTLEKRKHDLDFESLPEEFARQNSGRLLSDFLVGFLNS